MAFNLARGGKDWANLPRSPDNKLEDHHLFPKDWINNNKSPLADSSPWTELRDSILNRILVTKEANDRADSKVPPNYLCDITSQQRRILQIPDSFMGPLPTPIPYEQLREYMQDRYNLIRADFQDSIVEWLKTD